MNVNLDFGYLNPDGVNANMNFPLVSLSVVFIEYFNKFWIA